MIPQTPERDRPMYGTFRGRHDHVYIDDVIFDLRRLCTAFLLLAVPVVRRPAYASIHKYMISRRLCIHYFSIPFSCALVHQCLYVSEVVAWLILLVCRQLFVRVSNACRSSGIFNSKLLPSFLFY